jgi:hypothetical protein
MPADDAAATTDDARARRRRFTLVAAFGAGRAVAQARDT